MNKIIIIAVSLLWFSCKKSNDNSPAASHAAQVTPVEYTVLHNFDTNSGFPYGSLTISGKVMFGMISGLPRKNGCIFSIDTNGANYRDLFDFSGANGANSNGSLTLSGATMYGMTWQGGTSGGGCIFSIDTNGRGYQVLCNLSQTTGIMPYGSLTLFGDVLYGMASNGGKYGYGVIFSLNLSGDIYTDLVDFTDTSGTYPGGRPFGNLSLSNGIFYGMTALGGTHGDGVLFSFNPNGNTYTDLVNFTGKGSPNPYPDANCSLTLLGGLWYGMTQVGGANNYGYIFSYDSASNVMTDLNDFYPPSYGSLIVSGNLLFGMAGSGDGWGSIFSFDPDGSYPTKYTDLVNFTNANGKYPGVSGGSLTFSNGVFYGMTTVGGVNGTGLIFKLVVK